MPNDVLAWVRLLLGFILALVLIWAFIVIVRIVFDDVDTAAAAIRFLEPQHFNFRIG